MLAERHIDTLEWKDRRQTRWSRRSRRADALSGWEGKRSPESVPGGRHSLQQIRDAIQNSRWITELEPDWDGEDAPGYHIETWKRATRFLLESARWLDATFGLALPPPDIGPGPDGGIDLFWKGDRFELLLTVPEDPDAPASFYGDDRDSLSVRGETPLRAERSPLLLWVAERLQ